MLAPPRNGGAVPAGFIITQAGFPASLASPASFNAVNANLSYIPRDTRWPYIQNWFASLQRELVKHWVLEIVYTPSAALDGTGRLADYRGVASQRPNIVGDTTQPAGVAMIDQYWNKAAFVLPTASAPYGNLGRNAMRGPDFWQWDLGVNKSFKIPAREGMALQFRSEFFNFLNHSNFGTPDCNVSSASFATILPPRRRGKSSLR